MGSTSGADGEGKGVVLGHPQLFKGWGRSLGPPFHLSPPKMCSSGSRPVALSHCTQESLPLKGLASKKQEGGPRLCGPSDGLSPFLGVKNNLTPSCPLWGSIRNITKNPEKTDLMQKQVGT